MTLEKAHLLIAMRDHGLEAMGALSRKYGLDPQWGVQSDTNVDSVLNH